VRPRSWAWPPSMNECKDALLSLSPCAQIAPPAGLGRAEEVCLCFLV